jgi:hypothetical protein
MPSLEENIFVEPLGGLMPSLEENIFVAVSESRLEPIPEESGGLKFVTTFV